MPYILHFNLPVPAILLLNIAGANWLLTPALEQLSPTSWLPTHISTQRTWTSSLTVLVPASGWDKCKGKALPDP